MKTHNIFLLFFLLLLPLGNKAQYARRLSLPRQEQLSSQRVTQVIQDSEGFLWYATEGGGVCRDDGRQMLVFRSDAEHPDLLGSNDVASIAEAAGRYIIIGTFHGAYVLDKHDYSIRRLTDVDDNRVDDIIVSHDGHWWLTSNKKIYEYSSDGSLLKTYTGGDKYIFRLHEDRQGRLWSAEWEGGLLLLDNEAGTLRGAKHHPSGCRRAETLKRMPWPVMAAPTSIDDDPAKEEGLLIGTFGQGVVKYHPSSGTIETTEPSDSICMSRTTRDLRGRRLVADGLGNCYVLSDGEPLPWFRGTVLTRYVADSFQAARHLSARPTAWAINNVGDLWYSTGKDIRCMKFEKEEEVILSNARDVSAMTFTTDGTLWLATIFGTLMTYKDGHLATDDYASNEYSDAVVALQTDSMGRLVIASDRYVRLYDAVRHTLRQQNIEDEGIYRVELQETQPHSHWSQPKEEVVERMPQWVWCVLAALLLILSALVAYIWQLHRQRERFLAAIKSPTPAPIPADTTAVERTGGNVAFALQTSLSQNEGDSSWLQNAIFCVEQHIADDSYNVEQLARDMCMSRMTLYRKIQSATGQKPTEFIRTIRLRRAAELLSEGQLTITEISYATGFSSVSYFSRCFRTIYGVPPTLFGK